MLPVTSKEQQKEIVHGLYALGADSAGARC